MCIRDRHETHPPEARFRPRPKALLRNHAWILLNPRFQRFAAAGGFNFAGLFLYICLLYTSRCV